MVLNEVVGGLADGVQELWGYNRDNYLYDRTMRQDVEMKTASWRVEQARQWREDVRSLTGLTEKKMDKFLVVNTLQLGMCVDLFAQGRLQPGTPHWLLHLYILSLSAAFMYLLMSVWLAMHASVVAACERARLVTQQVRLPIPTWQQFDNMRSAAASFERLGAKMIRVPFVDTAIRQPNATEEGPARSSPTTLNGVEASDHIDAQWADALPMNAKGMKRVEGTPQNGHPEGKTDTWGLETSCNDIPELAEKPLHCNRHIELVRKAQAHYQCHDAYARVSMAFGTNQLLFAIAYFSLGYVSVGDGAPWPAATVAAVMVSLAVALVELDVSMSKEDKWHAALFMTAGPLCASLSVFGWCSQPRWEWVAAIFIPPAYLAHAMWLLFALRACQVSLHRSGSMLPRKFRTVMYLDVFGWLDQATGKATPKSPSKTNVSGDYIFMSRNGGDNTYSPVMIPAAPSDAPAADSNFTDARQSKLVADIRSTLASWQTYGDLHAVDDDTRFRCESLARRLHDAIGDEANATKPMAPPENNELPANLPLTSRDRIASADSFMSDSVLHCPESNPGTPTRWQPMKFYTDLGTEVRYMYDTQSGKVQHGIEKSGSFDIPEQQTSHPVAASDLSGAHPEVSPPEDDLESLGAAEEEMDELENLCRRRADELSERARSLASQLSERQRSIASLGTSMSGTVEDVRLREGGNAFECAMMSARKSVDSLKSMHKRANHEAAQAVPWLWADEDQLSEPSTPRPSNPVPQTDECKAAVAREVKQCMKPGEVTGEDVIATPDDKLPWKVFRYATLLLVFIWMLSPFMLYGVGVVGGLTEFGPKRVSDLGETRSFAEQEDPDGTYAGIMDGRYMGVDVEPSAEEYKALPMLPAGEIVKVQWPRQSTFVPQSLTCDQSGSHIVVSDDFSLYVGRLRSDENGATIEADRPLALWQVVSNYQVGQPNQPAHASRSLRGDASLDDAQFSFERVPHCTALEGQALKDVAIVCSEIEESKNRCRVLVLHTNGRRLTECPLHASGAEGMLNSSRWPVLKPVSEWKISGSWLDPDKESVESLAVDDECGDKQVSGDNAFDPDEVGCVVVGTSFGRVVQLRRHVSKDDQLVPEWAIQERLGKVAKGSLDVYPGGNVLMLRQEIGLVQAFEIHQGSFLGQWRLPDTVEWQTLTGGGDWLFMLGRERFGQEVDEEIKMWRFPLPSELKQAFREGGMASKADA